MIVLSARVEWMNKYCNKHKTALSVNNYPTGILFRCIPGHRSTCNYIFYRDMSLHARKDWWSIRQFLRNNNIGFENEEMLCAKIWFTA